MIMISEFLGNLPWRERVKKSIECFESEREEQKHQQQAIGRILNHKKLPMGETFVCCIASLQQLTSKVKTYKMRVNYAKNGGKFFIPEGSNV